MNGERANDRTENMIIYFFKENIRTIDISNTTMMLLVITFINETMHNYKKCNFSNSIKKNEYPPSAEGMFVNDRLLASINRVYSTNRRQKKY